MHLKKKKIEICTYPGGYTCVKAKTLKLNNIFPLWHVKMWYKEAHYTVLTKTPILSIKSDSAWRLAYFPPQSVIQSVSFSLLCDRKKRCQRTGFSGSSGLAVTDEVVKSDGQLQSFLSPRACLALTLCAMFSEGTRHSAVTQTGRQMARIDSEHERDWQSSNNP